MDGSGWRVTTSTLPINYVEDLCMACFELIKEKILKK